MSREKNKYINEVGEIFLDDLKIDKFA